MNRTDLIQISREQDEILKYKAQNQFSRFVQYTKTDYDFQWFHVIVCNALQKLYDGDIKKLMIFMPPQHGKSELSSRRFPAYALGKNPKLKIGVASYAMDLSAGFNRDCQNIIDEPKYKELFPDTRLNSVGDWTAKGELRNTHIFETVGHRGFFKSVGVRSALTGTPLDIGIIDDPFKDRTEANSPTIRDKVWEWYQDVFLTRLHNDSKQLLLFTRWHEDDIAGRILDPNNKHYDKTEADEWTILAFSALKEATKPIEQALDINDPREIDEALWEARHSAEKYRKRRRINPTGFQSLDQQRPSAQDGNKIKREWFQIIKHKELPFNPDSVATDYFIDGAYTEKTENDETGLLSCYYNKFDKKLYIFNCEGVRKELYELLKYFPSYTKEHHRSKRSSVFIELKASGHPLKSMLSKVEYGGYNTRKVNNKDVALGKLNRVENSEPFLASERIVLVEGGWNKKFIDQCASFPNGTHDDMVDVLCYAIHQYMIKTAKGGVSYQN